MNAPTISYGPVPDHYAPNYIREVRADGVFVGDVIKVGSARRREYRFVAIDARFRSARARRFKDLAGVIVVRMTPVSA
jgi:hypothetical protein